MRQKHRVALATSEQWPQLAPDEQTLAEELGRYGVMATPVVWSNDSTDWTAFDLVVIRSCWDYYRRIDEFMRWLDRLDEEGVGVANPPTVIRWNLHKSYLLDLESKGVRIPATRLLRKGMKTPHAQSAKVVVKPAISANAHETHLLSEDVSLLDRLLRDGDVIIQEFIEEVIADGEWSLVFFDREFSHAVKKAPRSGDFRVQVEHGGSAEAAEPPAQIVIEAEKALRAVDADLLYARVDLVDRPAGATLMEMELIEPSFFFQTNAGAVRTFAESVWKWVSA